jgi:hypothetical protein
LKKIPNCLILSLCPAMIWSINTAKNSKKKLPAIGVDTGIFSNKSLICVNIFSCEVPSKYHSYHFSVSKMEE